MSLDVYLELEGTVQYVPQQICIREDGAIRTITRAEWDRRFPGCEPTTFPPHLDDSGVVYHANITHNLNKMADAAGIYVPIWHPEQIGIETAAQLIDPLEGGLARLQADPDTFKALNPANGWGSYEGLVEFVTRYLDACRQTPTATVQVSR